MTRPGYTRIALLFLITLAGTTGGQCRTLQTWISKSSFFPDGHDVFNTYVQPRRRRRDTLETQREHCALLAAPWMESTGHFEGEGQLYRLRVLSLSEEGPRRTVFPEQPLFRFVRRVYRCCQMGFHCRGVKGIQGRLNGGSEVEFLLSADVLSVPVVRAEVHLHIVNPNHLTVEPWLPAVAKRDKRSYTRYSIWSKDEVVELRVDLLFLFQSLQAVTRGVQRGPGLADLRRVGRLARLRGESLGGGQNPWSLQDTDGEMWGGGENFLRSALELGLLLHCSRGGAEVPCEENGVSLLHAPFIALSYR
ncbi:uncharacterized protein si:ch211-170d8.2 [Anguilla anguilla]|uniref:Uncharacterized protein n=1 Tax=Anguilla anguilla TaxID=7936 RepID=A0A9D3RRK9_ANGAN|nr:uncharacterized protein si:ch211-170d8.2 [Anguilla anguilla]KAG5840704.1 hypothetical protein ANANG_G00191520 [Anguilla anguilla]